ncbi:MAG TPA: ATP-binding cassette domain-containing protein, partial [Verrucomicrobiae bacterium]|nr:ATP-binding cassette domain-containing protein [Verrucomicrobiae bacterium]
MEPTRHGPGADELVIRIEGVSKAFQTPDRGRMTALENISLNIPYGEFITIVGPSGCGKSTLLKLIAGLTPISGGRILYQGAEVRDLNTK